MWLYTVKIWSATVPNPYVAHTGSFENVEERQEARFCRSKSPNDGLRLLLEMSAAFKNGPRKGSRRYIVEYKVISMVQIPDDTDPTLLAELSVHELSAEAVTQAYLD